MGAKKMLAAALAFSVAATSIPLPGGVLYLKVRNGLTRMVYSR